MTGRTHIVGGIASLWLVAPWIDPRTVPIAIGALAMGALVGSLLPDMDAEQATLARFSFRLDKRNIHPLAEPARLLSSLFGHRGVLHSAVARFAIVLITAIVGSLLFGGEGALFTVGVALGYASHLLLDGMTIHDIPLYWPDLKSWHALPRRYRISTGTPQEDLAFVPFALASLALLLYWLHQMGRL